MSSENIIGIVAYDPNGLIGKDDGLPWHYPDDLAHFAATTHQQTIVMGYRTYLSMPKHYLKDRLAIVFTHEIPEPCLDQNVVFVSSLSDFLALPSAKKKCYIIGGAEIYTLFLRENLISEMIVTEIKKCYEGNVFFPKERIQTWPKRLIRETVSFTIFSYLKPLKDLDAAKSL